VLKVESISFRYGAASALREVSLVVDPGRVVSLLGMNGAGKTTLLNLISGLLRPSEGSVSFEGERISGLKPSRIVQKGVIHVPEGRQLFAGLTVRENLEIGAYLRIKKGRRAEVAENMRKALKTFPVLEERLEQLAGTLSGGEQQMLALSRGLMARPRMLLLDEPSLGLAPIITANIFRIIKELPASGCGVLLVEQNALGALSVSQYGYVITNGRIRLGGAPESILDDELLREAFLGPERSHKKPAPKPEGVDGPG